MTSRERFEAWLRLFDSSDDALWRDKFSQEDYHFGGTQAAWMAWQAAESLADADANRWRWLRQCKGWPESEAFMLGATPELFDQLADAGMTQMSLDGQSEQG